MKVVRPMEVPAVKGPVTTSLSSPETMRLFSTPAHLLFLTMFLPSMVNSAVGSLCAWLALPQKDIPPDVGRPANQMALVLLLPVRVAPLSARLTP